MTRAVQEPSGLPGSVEKDRRSEPPGFLTAYPGYRSTALLDRLRVTEYSYLDAERFLAFLETTYRDRAADTGGLAPRVGC